MRLSLCPVCGENTPHLPNLSEGSYVIYFRCSTCHHVWAVNKSNPGVVHHVTLKPPRGREKN